jgi:hypothetical protein
MERAKLEECILPNAEIKAEKIPDKPSDGKPTLV